MEKSGTESWSISCNGLFCLVCAPVVVILSILYPMINIWYMFSRNNKYYFAQFIFSPCSLRLNGCCLLDRWRELHLGHYSLSTYMRVLGLLLRQNPRIRWGQLPRRLPSGELIWTQRRLNRAIQQMDPGSQPWRVWSTAQKGLLQCRGLPGVFWCARHQHMWHHKRPDSGWV